MAYAMQFIAPLRCGTPDPVAKVRPSGGTAGRFPRRLRAPTLQAVNTKPTPATRRRASTTCAALPVKPCLKPATRPSGSHLSGTLCNRFARARVLKVSFFDVAQEHRPGNALSFGQMRGFPCGHRQQCLGLPPRVRAPVTPIPVLDLFHPRSPACRGGGLGSHGALHDKSILSAAASTTFAGITGFAAFPRIESDNTSSRVRSRLGPAARL